MIGTKRRNVSLSSNNSDDLPFHKRGTPESPFGNQVTTPTEGAGLPSLDRRKAARLHVRALNTEFASWVQSQLQDHPDELWEDGMRDYLTHASDILEKFTDVINWLKTKTVGDGSVSALVTNSIEKENGPETINKEKSVPVKSMFGISSGVADPTSSSAAGAPSSSTSVEGTSVSPAPWSFGFSASSQTSSQSPNSSLTTSWSTGAFGNKSLSPVQTFTSSFSSTSGTLSNNQTTPTTTPSFTNSTSSGLSFTSVTPSFGTTTSFSTPWSAGAFTFGGSQSPAPSNNNAKEDADEEDEPEQPSSPSLKKAEEKGIVVVHETKCKLFIKSTDPADKEPWKDKGTGQLFIKCEEGAGKGTKESKPRILVRNDVGRIMLNASLYTGIKTNLLKNAIVAIFHTLDEKAGDSGNAKAVGRTFLIRIKNEEERNKLADVIREHAPAA